MADDRFVQKARIGKRIEKAFGKEKSSSAHDRDEELNRAMDPNQPYMCTGQFHNDFTELCRRAQLPMVPAIIPRPRRPPSPTPVPVIEEKSKPTKGSKKEDKVVQVEPEVDTTQQNENNEPQEAPPKTYTTKDKFEYFKPCIQVEMDNPDKQEGMTEIYVRGWKIDDTMMNVFKQSLPAVSKLHTINFWNAGLSEDTVCVLALFLHDCENLKLLILDNNPVKEEPWHYLLRDDSPVQHLSLRFNGITDSGTEKLGQALGTIDNQGPKSLVSLDLTGNKITDTGVEHLANGLRMNRNLLTLSLANNFIGNTGAKKLAEVISRFTLTHEEIVARRKLVSSTMDTKSITPIQSGKKLEARERPVSQRSSNAAPSAPSTAASTSKGKTSKTPTSRKGDPKTPKEEEPKPKGKAGKESAEKPAKKELQNRRSSGGVVAVESAKSTTKKSEKGSKKKQAAQLESESIDLADNIHPLLEAVENLSDGVLLLKGNMTLLSLNLANNEIEEEGAEALLNAVRLQISLQHLQRPRPGAPSGLMRLSLLRNKISRSSVTLQTLHGLLTGRDPILKKTMSDTDSKCASP